MRIVFVAASHDIGIGGCYNIDLFVLFALLLQRFTFKLMRCARNWLLDVIYTKDHRVKVAECKHAQNQQESQHIAPHALGNSDLCLSA